MGSHYVKQGYILILAISVFSASAGAQQPDDASIATWITNALYDDPRVASADITVTVMKGIATLIRERPTIPGTVSVTTIKEPRQTAEIQGARELIEVGKFARPAKK
ncbi:MAG: hypothetical protein PHC61_07390 [Chitinivibrionales bacterium]|nr:hypothetical protein [Chitinivibrionales bacterium]